MEQKIKRFVELSTEFTVDSDEIYEGFQEVKNNYLTFSGQCSSTTSMYINDNLSKQTTKLEQFETKQLEKISKAKRYDEYLELQSSLLEYYVAKEKLTKENKQE